GKWSSPISRAASRRARGQAAIWKTHWQRYKWWQKFTSGKTAAIAFTRQPPHTTRHSPLATHPFLGGRYDHHPQSPANFAGRRRHRSAVVLPTPHRLLDRRGD